MSAAVFTSISYNHVAFATSSAKFDWNQFRATPSAKKVIEYCKKPDGAIFAYNVLYNLNKSFGGQQDGYYSTEVSFPAVSGIGAPFSETIYARVQKNQNTVLTGAGGAPVDEENAISTTHWTVKRMSAIVAEAALTGFMSSSNKAVWAGVMNPLADVFLSRPASFSTENDVTCMSLYLAYVTGYEFLACTFPTICWGVILLKTASPDATGTTSGVRAHNQREKNHNSNIDNFTFAVGRAGIKTVATTQTAFSDWLESNHSTAEVIKIKDWIAANATNLRSRDNAATRAARKMAAFK